MRRRNKLVSGTPEGLHYIRLLIGTACAVAFVWSSPPALAQGSPD
ncbi:MAG: hypothetical protein V7647_1440, partial [Acidobacteriota bacterium]